MDLGDGARRRLGLYLDELYRWSPRLNLTTVPRHRAWARHVEDSLSLLEVAAPARGATLVDVGSGAGLPGVPIAVVRADLEVTLLEADARRSGFLIHVSGMLGLDRVRVLTARAETAGHDPALREHFDLAVSRATASAPALCELTLPLVRIGGRLIALVGDAAAAAVSARRAAELCGGAPPRALGPSLLGVDKLGPTPGGYPRRAGLPARRPL